MLNVVIGGGRGYIGKKLSSKLIKKKFNVRIISRTPVNKTDISWDAIKKNGIPDDTKYVINLSGRTISEVNPKLFFKRFNDEFLDELRSSRIETNKLLIKSLPRSTKMFISSSAIGFYKPDLEKRYTEEDSYVDYDFITRLVRDWEDAAKVPQPEHVNSMMIRTGVVLGSGSPFLNALYPSHRLGLGGPIGNGKQWLSWIHIDDLIDLIIHLMTSSNVSGPINATAPCPIRQAHFSRALGESLNAPMVGRLTTPAFMMRMLLGPERVSMVIEGQHVFPSRAQKLGFKFKFPTLEDALEEIYGIRPSPVPTS